MFKEFKRISMVVPELKQACTGRDAIRFVASHGSDTRRIDVRARDPSLAFTSFELLEGTVAIHSKGLTSIDESFAMMVLGQKRSIRESPGPGLRV